MGTIKAIKPARTPERPSRAEAEKAVETLLRWIGEDPAREGLRETPARVVRAWDEHCAGYGQGADEILGRTFEETGGYNDFVLVKGIDFTSHCEHHMAPVIGTAHVAYWPRGRVVGISKLARVVDVFANRLTMQETMTRQILDSIDRVLKPKGTAVLVSAAHQCMTIRGAHKPGSATVTAQFSGVFEHDKEARERFLRMCG